MAAVTYGNKMISIIVPIYNTEKYLENCLVSLASQTYGNIEVIMIDDGSTDGSTQICKKFEANDGRFRMIRISNSGVSSARNIGLAEATGEFITFVDSDDYVAHDMIEYLYSLISTGDGDVSTCMLRQVDHSAERASIGLDEYAIRSDDYGNLQAIEEMLYSKNSIINGSFCKLFKTSLLNGLRFNKNIYYAEDLLMNYFIFKKARKVCVGREKKYYYRVHNASAMRKAFSDKRMSGLKACQIILEDARMDGDLRVTNAALNRLFMEAIAIILQVPRERLHSDQRNICRQTIMNNRGAILLDGGSKFTYRAYAFFYLFGINIGTKVVRVVRESKGEI